ncbi:MAG: pyrroline-5-carboxylate reductase [Alphaproteobacteria bacterium]|jgi:pyrroline-5-carboxylate reductase|nr:pyrroline-5-carboxylate reductase [Alphaproteobacteria bacterium]
MSRSPDLKDISQSIVLVGAGKMGAAMLQGWVSRGIDPSKLIVLDPQPAEDIKPLSARGVQFNPANRPAESGAIVIAVKPQIADSVVPPLAPMADGSTIVVSIMAGKTLAFFERVLPGKAIVRAMPNSPAAIGRGVTVAVGNARVSGAQRDLADGLLGATGAVEWISDEKLMDAVTAVSGSGPAYVFLLAESLTRAGIAAGLPPDLAAKLARETVTGAGELLHRSALDPATLRQNVTSPGGTTAAALEILMAAADGLDPLLAKAIAAAAKRSRELAG